MMHDVTITMMNFSWNVWFLTELMMEWRMKTSLILSPHLLMSLEKMLCAWQHSGFIWFGTKDTKIGLRYVLPFINMMLPVALVTFQLKIFVNLMVEWHLYFHFQNIVLYQRTCFWPDHIVVPFCLAYLQETRACVRYVMP